jgi:hypothetical protein
MRAILCSLIALAGCACGGSPPTKPDAVVPTTGLAQITATFGGVSLAATLELRTP